MRTLKALISKKTLHRAHTPKDNSNCIYCIANFDDSFSLFGTGITTVYSKDRIEVHVMYGETFNKHIKSIDIMDCTIFKILDTRCNILDTVTYIKNNYWRDCISAWFFKQVDTIKEALISKKTIHRAHVVNTYKYVIFPFEEDEDVISSIVNRTQSRDGWNFYIVDYDGFKKFYPFENENTKVFKSEKNLNELYHFIKGSKHNDLLNLCEDPNKLI